MKKQRFLKFLSLAISLCLLLTSMFTGMVISAEETAASTDVWDGSSVSEALSGSGTVTDPYLIQSGADLKYWSNKAAGGSGYSGQYFLLTNDIDLGGTNPVIYTFSGIFDGNGYEIKGLKVVYNTLENVGFFRTLSGGTVKNLTITGSVYGKSKVGGFVGTATNATLLNCVNNVTVKAEYVTVNNVKQSVAGGFVGYASAATTITNCVFNGSVEAKGTLVGGMIGNAYPGSAATINIVSCVNNGNLSTSISGTTTSCVGGFVGSVGANATINFLHSQNNGSVTSGATDVGGFVGTNYGNLKFDHCINAGTVSGNYAAGGFIGWNRVSTANSKTLTLSNCINLGTIKATRTDGGNGWLDGILGVHSGQNKSTTTVDKVYSINGCLDFGTSVNNQETATSFIGARKNLSDFTADNIESLLGFLYVVGENGPEFRKFSDGNGTKADPYVLKTKEDLLMLSQGVTVEQLTNYTDASFVLGNDIDLEGDARFVGIGNGYKSFQADFDGKGYTVSGVDINHAHLAGLGFFGLIGGTNERKIKNLNVKGDVTSTASTNNAAIVGGLVGKNAVKLTISNCSFDGTVYSTFTTNANYSAASGIICEVAGALDMSNCYVAGKIDGFGRGGSLVGSLNGNFAVNITNCYSVAEVTGIGSNKSTTTPTAGGLIGFIGNGALRLNNSFFAGTAPAERSSGYGGPIINHHAAGEFEYENVYYLADAASEFTTYNVGVNKTAAQFKDGTVLALLNTNGIVFAQGENHPILMTKPYDFADLTADGIVDTADAVVILRHVENVEELGEDALSFADINGDGDITEADYFTVKYIALVGIVVDEPEAASWSTLG